MRAITMRATTMRATTMREGKELLSPIAAAGETRELPADQLLEAFGRMTMIRVFEERVSDLYRDSEVPGFVHLSIGQ